MQVNGIFFDGEVAADRHVSIRLMPDGLHFAGPETAEQHWRFADLSAVDPPQPGHGLRLAAARRPGARLIIHDEDFKTALVGHARHLKGGINLHRTGRAGLWIGAGLAVLVLGIYVVLQLAPQRLAHVLPDSWRDRVGVQIEASLTNGAKLCSNSPGQAAISTLAARFAESNPDLPAVSINVYDVPVMNAFAMPGDRIVITRELLAKASSPDEVAGVLAHELGHVVLRHSEAQLVRVTGLQVLLSVVTGGGSDTMGSVAGLAAILRYTREAEAEADDFALATLAAAHIDPMGLKHFFELVLKQEGKPSGGAFGRIGTVLATHPGTEDRIKKIQPLPGGVMLTPSLTPEQFQALKDICAG